MWGRIGRLVIIYFERKVIGVTEKDEIMNIEMSGRMGRCEGIRYKVKMSGRIEDGNEEWVGEVD